jgi:hypothetical protein
MVLFFLLLILVFLLTLKNKELFSNINEYKILKINNWYGRLGNNIITISNALHIAIDAGYHAVIFQENSFFNKTYIKLKKCNLNTKNFIEYNASTLFYYNNPNILKKNKKLVLKYLTDLFKIKYDDIPKGGDNDLYIHIRGGDIFNDKNECININYCENQPDFNFYKNIIDNNNYDKIYIISEDSKNPVINKLLKEYSNIIFNKNSLYEDIILIMGCVNIIHSYTTFVPTILYFNKGIKNVYRNEYVNKIIKYNKYNKYNEFIS